MNETARKAEVSVEPDSKADTVVRISTWHVNNDITTVGRELDQYDTLVYHDKRYCIIFSGTYYIKRINHKTDITSFIPMIFEAYKFDYEDEVMRKFYHLIGKISTASQNEYAYRIRRPDVTKYLKVGNLKDEIERFMAEDIASRYDVKRYINKIDNVIGSYNGTRRMQYKSPKTEYRY